MSPGTNQKPPRRLVQFRLDTKVADRLKAAAASDGRTMSNMLIKVCTDIANGAQMAEQPQTTSVGGRHAAAGR